MPDTSLFSALKLGPPEYVFFIVLFGGALVAFNRKWIYSLTPVGRLYNLRREIRDLYALMGPLDFDDLHGRQKDKAIRLCRKLNKLRISHPMDGKAHDWYQWLPTLAALAESKELKEASPDFSPHQILGGLYY